MQQCLQAGTFTYPMYDTRAHSGERFCTPFTWKPVCQTWLNNAGKKKKKSHCSPENSLSALSASKNLVSL